MNKALKIISYIFLILIPLGCSGKYKKKQGKIYFSYWASPGDKIVLEVEGADAKSFATLRFKGYAADKNHVYWRGRVIENADANTFKPLSWSYSIDGKHVFYKDKILSASDPQTFQILENDYSLDCDSVYFKGKTLAGADSKTFNTIGHFYGKDKNAIYRLGQILNEIEDPETFRLLAPPEKKDKNPLNFFKAKKTDYLDRWGRDKANYYREGRKIEGIDYSTFTLLDDGYGSYVRDRYHVFYCEYPHSFIIEGADTETFEILNKYMDTAKDRNHYYEYGKIVAPQRKTPPKPSSPQPKILHQDLHISEQSATFVGMNPLARIKQVLNNRKKAPIAGIEGGFIGFPVGKLLLTNQLVGRDAAFPGHVSALCGHVSAFLGHMSALQGHMSAFLGHMSALPGHMSALLRQEVNYGGKEGVQYITMRLLLTN